MKQDEIPTCVAHCLICYLQFFNLFNISPLDLPVDCTTFTVQIHQFRVHKTSCESRSSHLIPQNIMDHLILHSRQLTSKKTEFMINRKISGVYTLSKGNFCLPNKGVWVQLIIFEKNVLSPYTWSKIYVVKQLVSH